MVLYKVQSVSRTMLGRGVMRRRPWLFRALATAPHSESSSIPQIPPFNYTPQPYTGPSSIEILEKRKRFLNPAIFAYYKSPINIVEGKMQYLFDEKGRRYLDAFAGIVTVSCGHCHPDVVDAIVLQTKLLQHTTTIYLHHVVVEYAEALTAKMPGDLKVVYFVNSGSEANDMAMEMARLYTGNYDIIALRNCYHGMSGGTMGLTGQQSWKYNIPQLEEEAGIKARCLVKRGILTFHFDDKPCPWEVHVFLVTDFSGVPHETEEMDPVWFSYTDIPFDKMWKDDPIWYPHFLKGNFFEGEFHFRNTHELVYHNLKIVQSL